MIDLRSDTVTRPNTAMRELMANADVGDDVYGEDPTVNRLEQLAMELSGHEAALFVSSGTQGNLLGIMSHCERGDEYIVGQQAHTYKFEGGGAAILGSIQSQPLDQLADGSLDLNEVASAIKPIDAHFARSKLLCLENTTAGRVLPLDYLREAREFAAQHQLGYHLDGARAFNAAVQSGVELAEITSLFDTVSLCLSKGLGAPVGSVLVGHAENIQRARRWRKVLGGGMRQAGIIAAAGIYALENNIKRLAEDHANARVLKDGLNGLNGIRIDTSVERTNMVFVETDADTAAALQRHLAEHDILVKGGTRMRWVTHLDVSPEDIATVVQTVRNFFAQ